MRYQTHTIILFVVVLILLAYVIQTAYDDETIPSTQTMETQTDMTIEITPQEGRSISASKLRQIMESMVGKTLEEAQEIASDIGFRARAVMIDGQTFAVTQDYDVKRFNLEIENGRVTKVKCCS